MKFLYCIVISILTSLPSLAQDTTSDSVYLFSYFKGNGEDGLHLAFSHDGYHFTALHQDQSFLTPMVGEDKLIRDPCIILGPDNIFHMVWTVSWKEKGLGIAHSRDLIHWSDQKFIPVMAHEDSARNTWAPEIYYDKDHEQYVIYWATTISGKFPETSQQGDNQYNHRMYYTTTRNFQQFSPTQLFYDQGFNVIDGTIQQGGKQYYLFLKDETRHPAEKNIRVATSKQAIGPYSRPSAPITGDYWAEGPTAIQVDGKWIVYFDKYVEHQMGAVTSDNLKDWNDISEQITFPEGTRHGTVFKVPSAILEALRQDNR